MARESNSPYADWRPIPLTECIWIQDQETEPSGFSLPPTGALLPDLLTGQLNGGGETPKVTPTSGLSADDPAGRSAGYAFSMPLPDFLFAKQPGRFPAWDGLTATPMDLDGSLMRCLQIENIVVGGTGEGGAQAPDLVAFAVTVKYRGFGSNIDASTPSQDQRIAPAGAFGDMSLPSVAPFTQNLAVTFQDPDALSIARIRTLVVVPFTCAMGDQVEIASALVYSTDQEVTPLQWYSARYRWIDGFPGPLPQAPNTSVQLLGQDAEGYFQLFGQSRLDDLPYEP